MADEYDPTDCELGICGPCERCQEQIEEEAIMSDKSVTEKTPIGTIEITPSWQSIVGLYLELLDRPEFTNNATRRQAMKDEILRVAKLADLYVKEHKR